MHPVSAHHFPQDNLPKAPVSNRLVRRPGSRVWAWVLLVLALSVALWGTFRVFVASSQGQILDHAALASADVRLQSLHQASVGLLADLPIVVAGIAAVGFFVLTLWRRRWKASLLVGLTFGAANITTQVLKELLQRPELANGVPYYTGNSLPSGHVTFATSALVAVFLLVAPRWRSTVAFIGMVFSTIVGVATFLDGWHRPADIVAAYLVAGIWAVLGGFFIYRICVEWNIISPRSRAQHASLSEILLWIVGIVGLAATAVLILFGGTEQLPQYFEPAGTSVRWFIFGVMFITGASATVHAVLATFFRWEAGRQAAAHSPWSHKTF